MLDYIIYIPVYIYVNMCQVIEKSREISATKVITDISNSLKSILNLGFYIKMYGNISNKSWSDSAISYLHYNARR